MQGEIGAVKALRWVMGAWKMTEDIWEDVNVDGADQRAGEADLREIQRGGGEQEMSEAEFAQFCRDIGYCNVDMDGPCEVSCALEILSRWFQERPNGCVPALMDVCRQIEMIQKITI